LRQGGFGKDAETIIERGIFWTDAEGTIQSERPRILAIAARVLSEIIGREVSTDYLWLVIYSRHEYLHGVIGEEDCRRLQKQLRTVLGEKYAQLVEYFQNMYGNYDDELTLLEELAVNVYMER